MACVLDGELVAGAGLPSDFYGIAGLVSSRHGRAPLTFVAFDILRLVGDPLIGLAYARRRQLLEEVMGLSEGALIGVNTFPGDDLDDVLDCCEQLDMEGVVVKRADAPYRPGKRTPDWRKVKCAAWREQHAERRLK